MVRSYKCPSCGGDMVFNAQKEMLVCASCDTAKTVSEMEAAKTSETDKQTSKEHTHTGDFNLFQCPSCGAEILTDLHTAATFCSYCNSPTLIESRLNGEVTPSYVIPFKINKIQTTEAFLAWVKKGRLTPKEFGLSTTIEKITGMYVPFWLYDFNSDMQMQAHCTNTRRERRGDYEYTHTDHYDVYRDLATSYSRIPVDASEKMDDTTMDLVEPFDYSALTPFEMGYLAGYQAEKYNYDKHKLKGRAEVRVRQYITDLTRSTIRGYSSVRITHSNINMQSKNTDYALMPVWMLRYRYKGKDYSFTMNGQTGKIVGKLPVSKAKAALYLGAITVSGGVIINLLLLAFNYFA